MPRVMVVDDTTVVRETVARLLRREGFETICAANGQEALDALRTDIPDLILLDLMMPVMDGITCLHRLREDPIWRSLPVVVMTALCDDQSQHKAEQLGIQDYLIKARFTVGQMLACVRANLPPEN